MKQRASALISLGLFLADTTSLSHSLQGGQSYNTVKQQCREGGRTTHPPAKCQQSLAVADLFVYYYFGNKPAVQFSLNFGCSAFIYFHVVKNDLATGGRVI